MSRLFDYVIFVFQIAPLALFSIQVILIDMKSIENYEEIYSVKKK
jgi:hypothetical protein